MTIHHDHVNPCAGAGHHIANFTLVRCRHRESYTLTAWYAADMGDDDQSVFMNEQIEFGPFDTSQEIEARVNDEMQSLLTLALASLRAREGSGSI